MPSVTFHLLIVIMLDVIMRNVVMLSVVMLIVIMLIVVAPSQQPYLGSSATGSATSRREPPFWPTTIYLMKFGIKISKKQFYDVEHNGTENTFKIPIESFVREK